jgi:hypothetical protein
MSHVTNDQKLLTRNAQPEFLDCKIHASSERNSNGSPVPFKSTSKAREIRVPLAGRCPRIIQAAGEESHSKTAFEERDRKIIDCLGPAPSAYDGGDDRHHSSSWRYRLRE